MIKIPSFQETLSPYLSDMQFSNEDEMFDFVDSDLEVNTRPKLFKRAVPIDSVKYLPPALIGSGLDFLYSNYFINGCQLDDLSLSYKPENILNEFTYIGADVNENAYKILILDGSIHSQYHYEDNSILIAKSFEAFIRVYLNFNGPVMQMITEEEFRELCKFLGVDTNNHYWRSIRELGEPILKGNEI